MADLIARGLRAMHLGSEVGVWMVALLVLLGLVAVVWIVISLLRLRQPRARRPEDEVLPLATAAVAWDAAAWRSELERCLAEERIGDALRAAWWWLARSIAGPEVEPDWTSRDLLGRTKRKELRDVLRRLDLLTFGADRPGMTDLRQLAEQIRGALG